MIVALMLAVQMLFAGIPGQAVGGPYYRVCPPGWCGTGDTDEYNSGTHTLIDYIRGNEETLFLYNDASIINYGAMNFLVDSHLVMYDSSTIYSDGPMVFDPGSTNFIARFTPRPPNPTGPGGDVNYYPMEEYMENAIISSAGSIYLYGHTTIVTDPVAAGLLQGQRYTLAASYSPYTIDLTGGEIIAPGWDLELVEHYASGILDGHLLLMTYTGTPVPEPSTILLLASGLVGLAGSRFRRPTKTGM